MYLIDCTCLRTVLPSPLSLSLSPSLSLSLSLCVSDVGDFVKEDEVIAEIETDKVME